MSFGFSVGDFLAAGTLIKDIVTCLKDSGGAVSQYQELMRELDGLQHALDKIERLKETPDRMESICSIKVAALNCAYVLRDFRRKLDTYEGLGPGKRRRSGKDKLKMVRWELSMKEDVQNLRMYLQMHTSSLITRLAIEGLDMTAAAAVEAGKNHDTVDRKFSDTQVAVLEVQSNVINILQEQESERKRKLLDWLSPSALYDKQQYIFSRHQEGTGSWLLEDDRFVKWVSGEESDQVLWCAGHPGAGKTVMSSLIIEHLQTLHQYQNVGIAFMYLDYRDASTAADLASSIIRQLTENGPNIGIVDTLCKKFRDSNKRPPFQELQRALLAACGGFDQVFVVIDALDECSIPEERRLILTIVEELTSKSSTRILITSRPNFEDINTELAIHSRIEIVATHSDIELYLRQKIKANKAFMKRISAIIGLESQVVHAIAARASGMFLMAVLQLDRILTERTSTKIQKALQTLPSKLETTYQDTLERIRKQAEPDNTLGIRILQWVAMAKRQFRFVELCQALAIEWDEDQDPPQLLDRENILDADSILDVCGGLVVIEPASQLVRLVHFTMEEYFRRNPSALAGAHEDICKTCLIYLCFDDVKETIERAARILCDYDRHYDRGGIENRRAANDKREELVNRFPLLSYAACYYLTHAQNVSIRPSIEILFIRLFKSQSLVAAAFSFGVRNRWREGTTTGEMRVTALHILATVDLPGLASLYLRTIPGPNPTTEEGRTPLHWAVARKQMTMLRFLLDNGADMNQADQNGWTAFIEAASSELTEAVKVLGQYGADVNAQNIFNGWTALHYAAVGRYEMVPLLLDMGANTNLQNENGETPIIHAIEGGHIRIVAMLLKAGARLDISFGSSDLTPLRCASSRRNWGIVKLLLEAGASVDAQCSRGMTALHCAARWGHYEVAKALLAAGASTEIENEEGLTALMVAREKRRSTVIRLLEEWAAAGRLPGGITNLSMATL